MANARKCNKCGTCFDPLDSPGIMCRFRNPIFQTSNDIREGVVGFKLIDDESTEAIIDLCPKCADLFREFMKGGVKIKTGDKMVEAADLIRALFMGGEYDGDG